MATARELGEIEIANTSGRPPVVFVHGLWLLAGSWQVWQDKFEAAGFATVAPGWPDEPESVGEGRANPSVFAGKSVGAITAYYADVIARLERKPGIVGHSFGGLITQKLAGMGLGTVSVPIDPAPGRGVLPLPLSALRASFPALRNPANRKKAVMLTYDQFRFAFVNAVPEDEARRLYDEFPVPGAGLPLFQAAVANFNPKSETLVDRANPDRGPMKFLSGEKDHTVPWAITNAAYQKQRGNAAVTEIEELPGRGHSLVIDSGWEEVADAALTFVQKYHA
ncbi:alpha/beta hydrolase [Kribbella sp. NBC_01484]|uniref:alpha/beta hydrolase n=1 Tax=Kribbella sp. NBC_01484 TaxID=2903579 RepID=UPI002E3600FF|nr:alpha/beta hydrolase [Kribbella sp. NBC_01484]